METSSSQPSRVTALGVVQVHRLQWRLRGQSQTKAGCEDGATKGWIRCHWNELTTCDGRKCLSVSEQYLLCISTSPQLLWLNSCPSFNLYIIVVCAAAHLPPSWHRELRPFTDSPPMPPLALSLLHLSSTLPLQHKAINREREAVTAESVRLGAVLTLLVSAWLHAFIMMDDWLVFLTPILVFCKIIMRNNTVAMLSHWCILWKIYTKCFSQVSFILDSELVFSSTDRF